MDKEEKDFVVYKGKRFFPIREEAEKNKTKNDRIFYVYGKGYYLISSKKIYF
ncbi:MAG: hypothetical protein ACOCUI_01845 [bacterium]